MTMLNALVYSHRMITTTGITEVSLLTTMIRHSFPAVIEGNLTGTSCVTKPRWFFVGDLGDLGSVMGSTAAACFFKSWTPRTTQFGSPDVSPSRCMVKAAVKLSVSPLRGKLLVLSLCVLLPTWRRSTSPFAAPRFRGTRLGQGRQGRQEDPLSRNALSPVIQAWQLQQERDREYDELLRGGFSKEKMLLGWESMSGCLSLILFCWFSSRWLSMH